MLASKKTAWLMFAMVMILSDICKIANRHVTENQGVNIRVSFRNKLDKFPGSLRLCWSDGSALSWFLKLPDGAAGRPRKPSKLKHEPMKMIPPFKRGPNSGITQPILLRLNSGARTVHLEAISRSVFSYQQK
jgi:hypothetical protein